MSPLDAEELSRMDHLSEAQITRYLDRSVPAPELPLVEAHLAECDACRHEVVGAARVLRARPRMPVWQVAAAAAAGIALLLLVPQRTTQPNLDVPVLRDGSGSEGLARIEPISPLQELSQPGRVIVFAWHPVAGGESYRLMVVTESGDSVWAGRSSDTTVAVPIGEQLRPGGRYFWFVDGLLRDGRSATTGSIPFSTPP